MSAPPHAQRATLSMMGRFPPACRYAFVVQFLWRKLGVPFAMLSKGPIDVNNAEKLWVSTAGMRGAARQRAKDHDSEVKALYQVWTKWRRPAFFPPSEWRPLPP